MGLFSYLLVTLYASTPDQVPTSTVITPAHDGKQVEFLGQMNMSLFGESPETQAQGYFQATMGAAIEFQAAGVEQSKQGAVVYFKQTSQGIPVEGTHAMAQIRYGMLRYATYRFADLKETLSPIPKIAPTKAQQVALAAMAAQKPTVSTAPNLVIAFNSAQKPVLAWRVPVDTTNPYGSYWIYIDATTQAVIGSKKASVDDLAGNVTGDVHPTCQDDAPKSVGLPFVQWSTSAFANAAGQFISGTAFTTTTVNLTSPYIALADQARGGLAPAAQSLALQSTAAGNVLSWGGGASALTDAYYNYHGIRNWVAERLLTSNAQLAWTKRQITVTVNRTDEICNAFYNTLDGSLNFFATGGGCINTATVPGIMHHEYGHGLQFNSGNSLTFDKAMAEGTADVVAIYSLQTDRLVGLPLCASTFRSCVNTFSSCAQGCTFNATSEEHDAGQVICAVWHEIRTGMQNRYGSELGQSLASDLFLSYLTIINADMTSSYQSALAVDEDTDNNPANGTVHSCEINAAFKGGPTPHLPDVRLVPSLPSLAIIHQAPGTVTVGQPLQITATLKPHPVCDPNPKITQPRVNYQLDGDPNWHVAPMQDMGSNVYTATLTDVQTPATIHYTITANLDGSDFIYPYQMQAPRDGNAPYYKQTLRYTQEDDTLFSTDAEDGDDGILVGTSAADGVSAWQLGLVVGMGGDPLSAHSGKRAWGSGLAAANSVDPSKPARSSMLILPTLDARAYKTVHVRFWSAQINSTTRLEVNGIPVTRGPANTFFWRDPIWMFQDIDISSQAAGKDHVEIRFVVQNNTTANAAVSGWNLDDIAVTGLSLNAASRALNGGPFDGGYGYARATCSNTGPQPWLILLGLAALWRRRTQTQRH